MSIKQKIKNPFFIIVIITLVSLLPMVALLFDRLLLNLSYSALFYIEIFAGIIFVSTGLFIAYIFLKS
jgi:hypothetical protein